MPQEVIYRLNKLGKSEDQPQLLTLFDRNGRIIGENKQSVPNPQLSEYDTGMYDLVPVNTNNDFGVDPDDDADGMTTDVLNLTQ